MNDLISRQQAIDAVRMVIGDNRSISVCDAIKQLPPIHPVNNSETPNSSDCISRQAAIDAVMECYDNDELFEVYEWKLNELPHIQPIQPKKGKWIKLDMHRGMADHKCTVCEQECYVPTCMGEPMYAFCPNCGADMREVNHESN